MIHSILQIFAFQILFLIIYDLFLKNETFFGLNRVYLLLTTVLGFVLPFISLVYIQENFPQEYLIELPAVLIGSDTTETITSGPSLWLVSSLGIWLTGSLFSALFFIWKFKKIVNLKYIGTTEDFRNFKIVILPGTDKAFSFFDTIYLGENISEVNKENIIAHEKIHIDQKHSLDLLFFELLRIIFWFNPMVYMFQNRIATLHEFIADAEVTAKKDKKQYYQNLISEVFQTEQISFINTFFNQSLIKKRIIMLQKSKSRKTAQLKYLLLLPLIGLMLVYASCSDEMGKKEGDLIQQEALEVDKEITDVPFSVIEKVPTYPGCSGDNETRKKCMSNNIAEFINANFNIKLADELNLSGRQRIAVQFKIDKTGKIVDVRARAPKPELEAEAIRVVQKLPQLQPGEQKGEKVGVLYSLPIVFDVVE